MAMDCQQLVDLVVDYLDGDLGRDKEQRLETHLDDCPECVEFLDSYRQTGTVCRRALKIEMPAPLQSTLLEFLRSELQSPDG